MKNKIIIIGMILPMYKANDATIFINVYRNVLMKANINFGFPIIKQIFEYEK